MEGPYQNRRGRWVAKCASHLLKFSVPLPEPVSLTRHDGQDGRVRGI